ncbi:hypothetical protein HNY73_019753 [Argiope bruennichi]|uniref:Uncharacterized protein n=1 Tax=Argiope bruennichi TaxID=94029 RepID=A0A8T0E5Q1_ARGBR|nr:hypothetical protein HNY73_019753 [Argiope bruennichi]
MGKKANHKFRLNDNERVKAFALLSDLRNLLREKEEKDAEESITKEKAKPAKTYAEVTATKQAHTVLLLPKENSKENVKKLVEENVQPTKEKMAINALRPLRNKGIAVHCSDEEGAQKLIQMIQGNQRLAETIECKKPSTRHPRCIVYDIPNGIADLEVLEVLELTNRSSQRFSEAEL